MGHHLVSSSLKARFSPHRTRPSRATILQTMRTKAHRSQIAQVGLGPRGFPAFRAGRQPIEHAFHTCLTNQGCFLQLKMGLSKIRSTPFVLMESSIIT